MSEHVSPFELPWGELVRRVAEDAADGSGRARLLLEDLLEHERGCRASGSDPLVGSEILRLCCTPHVQRPGR